MRGWKDRLEGLQSLLGQRSGPGVWQDSAPIRSDLFGTERLEHHAQSLAAAQLVSTGAPLRVQPLGRRVKENADILLAAYRTCAEAVQAGQVISPAAEWLLDNFHLVEQQLRQIHDDLPPGYYRQLPKLSEGPFAGYPRVFGLTWAYVAHTDSLMSGPVLARFVRAYQQVQPLMIGEIWAVAITLRIVLVENMRRLAVQIVDGHALRQEADAIVDAMLAAPKTPGQTTFSVMQRVVAAYETQPLPDIVASQIAKRLRGLDPLHTPLLGWLEERLERQGTTLDEVIASTQTRLGASNVTMRNIVTSMRLASEMDWADFFEDVSLVDARLRSNPTYPVMDFATRNRYRTEIEILAQHAPLTEGEVTNAALAMAAQGDTEHRRDPGYWLIGEGRADLEAAIGFRPPVGLTVLRRVGRMGLGGYVASLAAVGLAILTLALALMASAGAGPVVLVALAVLGAGLAAELATAIVNTVITRSVPPKPLPGLDLARSIPAHLRTLVAVPVLLRDVADIADEIERLEVHHLSSTGGAVHYALLSDGPDSPSETDPKDARLIAEATAAIARLNERYPGEDGDRFHFLHRRRRWNPAEGVWMGWERKRGKLAELNRLLRGATDTSYAVISSPLPTDIRYVITLDADTRLLRGTVAQMVGKIAHPLNRARLDTASQRVTGGYGILQPRVSPSLPAGQDRSVYQSLFSSPGGIEPYAAAASDLYQDLFGEGTFTGKGIYDVDAFEAALDGRVPENALLSHDLFEGTFARAALASDIEVVEDYPPRYDVDIRRQHRWTRGDWQLLPWIFGQRRHDRGGLPAIGRWKMIDNLRRSLLAPTAVLSLLIGWLLPWPQAVLWTALTVAMLALPRLLALPFGFFPARTGVTLTSHFAALRNDTRTAFGQIAVSLALLADTAATMLDAVVRTVWRLLVSRRHLLEWMTAAQTSRSARPGLIQHYLSMLPGLLLGLATCAAAWLLNPSVWPLPLGFGLIWAAAPAVAHAISQPRVQPAVTALTPAQAQELRLIGRRTWRYFETFVTPEENFLPPDNFQEIPRPAIATRTSPTNIGLYLLSTVAAHDMGWIGQRAALQRLHDTLQTIQRMPRFRGHLYNWHDTRDLRVLDPAYVSSVDSGNLAGHLIAVAQTCRAWTVEPPRDDHVVRQAMADCALLARRSLGSHADDLDLIRALSEVASAAADPATPLAALTGPMERALSLTGDTLCEAKVWTTAMRTALADHLEDLAGPPDASLLHEVEALCRILALEMDFGFLLDTEKKLLSIGFSVATNRLDTNCYDLLASEARLASLFAIAKGDVETRHWFRLGRPATPIGSGSALISWSGSMFEYLMPSLVMRAPAGSVLEQTTRLIVARQRAYAAALGIPWGISESSYNARDLEMTYQYSNFGVPGLGLKRGLSENRVIAPYATGLAAMVDPVAAVENYAQLAGIGAEGRFGFYEAVDFTPARLPTNENHAIVRSFMAHHQGMTITAIANTLQNGRLRDRFHAEPMIQGAELLLQERIPRDVASAPPRATEVLVAPVEPLDAPAVRTFEDPAAEAPTAHLLSNGNYGVMLTPTGEGFSRWRDMAVTRWRDEAAQAALGTFLFLRDRDTGDVWSSGVQPTRAGLDRHRAVFCEHHAAFTHQRPRLATTTEVVVSAEDDAEARRITLTNSGRRARDIEVTSYAELVLAPPSSDLAHPAFSKMFVVTDYLPELGVIIATRRRRSPHDPEVWAAHIAVVEGEDSAPIQIETDRARFIGRGRSIATAEAIGQPLSGTTGTVLDPIFSIRRSVRVPAGGTTRVTFWTMVADTPDALLDLVDRHRDASAFSRAATLAWTQAQVQLRHLGITHADAADFQALGGMVLRNDTRLRAAPSQIIAGAAPQSALWALGISGDLPIVLLQIEDIEDIAVLHQVISAHEYWQMRQQAVDLVVLNDRMSSYVQDLQIAIEGAVRSARTRPQAPGIHAPAKGTIHALRSDLLHAGARAQLFSVARVILVASRGDLASQLGRVTSAPMPDPVALPPHEPTAPAPQPELPKLEFFNGTGGFDRDGREYVTVFRGGKTTPAPWINVVSNPTFGFQVSAEGSGHVWSENSRENQLTPWSNDPVCDPAGEAIYLQDLETGRVWTATALPVRGPGTYVARHGFGYSRFQHEANGIAADMVQFVPLDAPAKVSRLTLRNTGTTPRSLAVTAYAEWVLGTSRGAAAPYIATRTDPTTGAILAQNTFSTAFPGRVAFADFGAGVTSLTADRAEFIGRGGTLNSPAGLRRAGLSGATGPALDPCAALQRHVTLGPGEAVSLTFCIGQADSDAAASALIQRLRAEDSEALLAAVEDHWSTLLGSVQVKTPDRAMDIMLNGWLMYQTLACRIWARAGFYQASGAYGFRDQLQDGMALTFARPEMTRAHLLRAASRQFPEGDVQHWWLPHSGQGVRTRISDDRIWLGYGVARYVAVSGDSSILDEEVPFLLGPPVPPGAHDDFFQPQVSDETASLFEHCARGLDQAIELTGENGMPLIGTGDWNDGMNRVGEGGRGTSVWLGWLLIATVDMMAPLADTRDPDRATRWRAHAKLVQQAIETAGWDGEWYQRGTFDDGTLLGSSTSEECRIDSIAQSWAVLSGAADPDRARQAMASMTRHLVRPDPGLALLFTPPFDRTPLDPGYIKGYPPGLRENGGQYSHAAMWAILAQARLGDGDAAHGLFAMLNPVNHALTGDTADRYKVEPYVVAADVYSTPPHDGRGGWTWYTGSAGWMYRAGIEGILGLTRKGDRLHLNPCLPQSWNEVTLTITLGDARYAVSIANRGSTGTGVRSATLNGTDLPTGPDGLEFPLQRGSHQLTIDLGVAESRFASPVV